MLYLSPAVNGNTLKVADLLPAMPNNHPSTTLDTDSVCHMTSDTRAGPSGFSACNIQKLGLVHEARLYEYKIMVHIPLIQRQSPQTVP